MLKYYFVFIFLLDILNADAWKSSAPLAERFDWLQLTSGEWLKGDIKGMYDESLEFDSDKLDLLSIDWEDVKQLKSASPISLNMEGDGTIIGQLNLYENNVTLIREEGEVVFERGLIISFTGGDQEKNYWSIKLAAGMTLSSGNTDQTEYTAKLTLKRQTAITRFKTEYIGNYNKTNEVETENNHRLNISLDVFETRKFFWRPVSAEYYKDTFQNIDAKYTYGVGVGYDIVASPKTEWTVFAGPAIQTTYFVDVEPGEDDKETTPAFVVSSDYEIELTRRIDFIAKYQAYFVNQKSGTYIHHALATIETELINDFDLDFTFMWDRVQDPTADADGSVPERDDYKMIFSIAYTF